MGHEFIKSFDESNALQKKRIIWFKIFAKKKKKIKSSLKVYKKLENFHMYFVGKVCRKVSFSMRILSQIFIVREKSMRHGTYKYYIRILLCFQKEEFIYYSYKICLSLVLLFSSIFIKGKR